MTDKKRKSETPKSGRKPEITFGVGSGKTETALRAMAGVGERVKFCAELAGSVQALAQETAIPRRTLDTYIFEEAELKASRLVSIAEAAGVRIEWLATGRGVRWASAKLRDLSDSWWQYRQTAGQHVAEVKALQDFVVDYNAGSAVVSAVSGVPEVTFEEVQAAAYGIAPAGAVAEARAEYGGDSQAADRRELRLESALDRLRAATADIQRLTGEVDVEPGSLWATVIQELMVFHGLTAEGARRILETLRSLDAEESQD